MHLNSNDMNLNEYTSTKLIDLHQYVVLINTDKCLLAVYMIINLFNCVNLCYIYIYKVSILATAN